MTKSARLTTLGEFAMDINMRPEELAGFRAWLGGKRCASDDEWRELHAQYTNRQLGSALNDSETPGDRRSNTYAGKGRVER